MLTVREVTTKEEFYLLRSEWNDLLSRSESNNIFLTWEWIYNWWNIFGRNMQLKILLVKDSSRIVGIAPLYVHNGAKGNQIALLGSSHVGSDYLDFILQKGREQESLIRILSNLSSNSGEWNAIHFNEISAVSSSIQLIQDHFRDNYLSLIKKQNDCPYILLPASHGLFMNSLSSNMRYNIKRKRSRFENDFQGEFVVIREKGELQNSLAELFRLNLNRTRMKNICSPFSNNQFAQFHRELIMSAFDRGWVKLCFLKIRGELIACIYIFKYGNKYYYYQSGFNPEWEKLSPGFLLFSYSIENAISEGMHEFDFLQGAEDYKYNWTKKIRTSVLMTIYKKSFRNRVRYIREKFSAYSKSKIKESLSRIGLHHKNGYSE